MLDGRYYGPSWSSLEYPSCYALAYKNKGLLLAPTKSAVDPGSSPEQVSSCWLSLPTCCFNSCSLFISAHDFTAARCMKHHTPALRYNCLEETEVTSTLISWPSWPCLNSGEQASGAFLCAQKEKRARNIVSDRSVYYSLNDVAWVVKPCDSILCRFLLNHFIHPFIHLTNMFYIPTMHNTSVASSWKEVNCPLPSKACNFTSEKQQKCPLLCHWLLWR